jgi:hypothetical protein
VSLDADQLAKVAGDLKRDVLEEVADDLAAPSHTLIVTKILLEKPWVKDFLMPLVSPLRSTMRSHLKMSVMRAQGHVWYFPSFHWWRAHARMLHGEDGSSCDVAGHVHGLTEGSPKALFQVADLLKDGSLHVLGEEDFRAEARHWQENYRVIGSR